MYLNTLTVRDIVEFFLLYFFISNIKVYIDELQTNSLLYNATKTLPGGAKYNDYPRLFNMNIKYN